MLPLEITLFPSRTFWHANQANIDGFSHLISQIKALLVRIPNLQSDFLYHDRFDRERPERGRAKVISAFDDTWKTEGVAHQPWDTR